VEILAFLSLALVTLIVGGLVYVDDLSGEDMAGGLGFLVATAIFSIGILPVLLYLGPLYTAYLRSESFSILKMIGVTMLPALLIALFNPGFAASCAALAIVIVVILDILARLWPGLKRADPI